MIYYFDPINTLINSRGGAELNFACPILNKHFSSIMLSEIQGKAEIDQHQVKVKIYGTCPEGEFTSEVEGENYINSLKKARINFRQQVIDWIQYRYGPINFENSCKLWVFDPNQPEAERIRLIE